MKSSRQEIKDEETRLIKSFRDFMRGNNRKNFKRYIELIDIIAEEKKRAISRGEKDKLQLTTLVAALSPDESINHDTQIQHQIDEYKKNLESSRSHLRQLENEFYFLQQLIKPVEEKHQQAILALQQKNEELTTSIVRTHATLWKHNASRPRLYFNAIENNDFPGLQNLYRPTLANRFNHDGFTPLILAINKNHSDMVRWLLTKEDVNPETPITLDESFKGITPLCAAIIWENPDEKSLQGNGATGTLAALIVRGACINKPSTTNLFTPLHWAAFSGSKECIKFLLENNADITVLDNNGNTPLAIFTQRHPKASHFKSIKELFRERAKSDKPASRRKWF